MRHPGGDVHRFPRLGLDRPIASRRRTRRRGGGSRVCGGVVLDEGLGGGERPRGHEGASVDAGFEGVEVGGVVEGAGVGIGRRPVGSRDERDLGAGGERRSHTRAPLATRPSSSDLIHTRTTRGPSEASPSVSIEAERTARAGRWIASGVGTRCRPEERARGTSDRGRCPSARRCAHGPDEAAVGEENDVADADATRMGH